MIKKLATPSSLIATVVLAFAFIFVSVSLVACMNDQEAEEPVEEETVVQAEPIYTSTYEGFGAIFVQQCDEETGSLVTKASSTEDGTMIDVPQTVNLGTSQSGLIPVSPQAPVARGGIIRVNSDVETIAVNGNESDASNVPSMSRRNLSEKLSEDYGVALEWDNALCRQSLDRPKELETIFATQKSWNYGGALAEIPFMGIFTLEEIPDAINALGFQNYFDGRYTHIAIIHDEETGYGSIILWGPTEEYPYPPSEQAVLEAPVASTPLVESVLIDVVQVKDADIPGIEFLDESVIVPGDGVEVESESARIGVSFAQKDGTPVGTLACRINKEGCQWDSFLATVAGLNIMTALPSTISGNPIIGVEQGAIDDIKKTLSDLREAGNWETAVALSDAILAIVGTNDPVYAGVIAAVDEEKKQAQALIDAAKEEARIAAEQARNTATQQQYYDNNSADGNYAGDSGGGDSGTVYAPCWLCVQCGFFSWHYNEDVQSHQAVNGSEHLVLETVGPVG